jgi:hypothetical protein
MTMPTIVPPDIMCTLCGTIWVKQVPACAHTETEWDTYKTSNGLSDPYRRWTDPPAAKEKAEDTDK